jgi:apolipoprotein N-acyltransferase
LTLGLKNEHPKLIVWPETVIVRALNLDPALQARFGAIAKSLNAELVVGTFEVTKPENREYNTLFFFRPDGGLDRVYRKRQLVPFAEHLPLRPYLSWIPWAREVNDIGTGDSPGIVDADGMRIGPIVCWESAFSGLNVDDVRHGAQALAIATDDAWFGTTAGPYMHAQIAQMRAIETGRWIVRAAATGISGIIAPNGRYTEHSKLEVATVVTGEIGAPVDTAYDTIGPLPIALAGLVLYGGIFAWPTRRRVRR